MQFLKWVLFIILGLALIVVIMGLVGPKEFKVERSTVINAPPEAIWPKINSLKRIATWSPWMKMDTSMTVEYVGNDGEIGSMSKWKSKKSGDGEQTLTVLEPNKSSQVHLRFFTPFGDMESDSYINLEPDPAGTKVVWGIHGKNGFVGRAMGVMMNMEKNMTPHFDRGLADLQAIMAAQPSGIPNPDDYDIAPGDYPGGKYLGVRENVSMDNVGPFYTSNLPRVMAEVQKSAQIEGAPVGIFFTWDMEKKASDMAAAIGFKGDLKAPAGMQIITLPAKKAVILTYKGGYTGLGNAHNAMNAYIISNKITHEPPVIEEYVTDPGAEPDSMKWITKLTYFTK